MKWYQRKLIQFSFTNGEELPKSVFGWLQLVWNFDVFIGPFPLIKLNIISILLNLFY